MLVAEHISAGIARVDDDYGHCVVVCERLDRIQIHLPICLGKEIEVADLKIGEASPSFVVRVTGSGKEYVSSGSGYDGEDGF